MTGSTKIKKTTVKPQVPQSVIDEWLEKHPSVDKTGFNFSKLKDLNLSGTTKPSGQTKSIKVNSSTNIDSKKGFTNLPSEFNKNIFNNSNQSLSGKNVSELFKLTSGNVPTFRTSVSTSPFRTKSTPPTKVAPTKSAPAPKKLLKTSLSLSEPQLVFTAGTVDFSFPNGTNYGFDSTIYDIKVQPDGKILVAGDSFSGYYYDGDYYPMQGLIRLNADGTVDETFSVVFNDDCYGGGFNDTVYTIELQPDGKIICGGGFNTFDRNGSCNTANYIIRLNPDGSRDTSFSSGDGFNDEVYDLVLQPDGKIIVGGYFYQYDNTNAYHIIRLNSNGGIDTSFLIGDGSVNFNNYVNKIELLSDGKIICGGYFTTYGNLDQNYIVRLNSDGTKDSTFQVGLGFNGEVYTIGIQSDGKIVVGGDFNYFDNIYLNNGYITRLNYDGTLDTIFDGGLNDTVFEITIQPDDKILVGGNFGEFYGNFGTVYCDELVRFNSDCSFDFSFYYEELFNSTVYAITLQPDGKILIGGAFYDNGNPTVYPLNYFGRLNNSIQQYPYVYLGWTSYCFNGSINDKFVTVGSTTPPVISWGGPENVYSFKGLINPSQSAIGLAIPGSVLGWGAYPTNVIDFVQVNEYGVDDCDAAASETFNTAVCIDVFNGLPGPITIAVDKKYKVGDIGFIDYFTDVFGDFYIHSTFRIVELYEGNLDDVFPFSGILPYIPYESAEESVRINGQYIGVYDLADMCYSTTLSHQYDICNEETIISYKNCSNCGINLFTVSYFDNGDISFPYSSISGGTSIIQSTKVWSSSDECLKNSTPEGRRNYDFNDGGFNGDLVYNIVEQPDGKILIGGNFNGYDEVSIANLIRINSDGTIDTSFNNGGDGCSDYVRAVALQPDGKILIGGAFFLYNGVEFYRIVRVNPDGSIDQGFNIGDGFNDTVRAIAVQSDGKILVGGDFDIYDGFPCNRIVRLNSDGSPDPTFNIGDGFNDSVYSIVIEKEEVRNEYTNYISYIETILIGGEFDDYDNNGSGLVARLKSDGTFIDSFGDGFDGGRVFGMKRQPDGKLLIWGNFYYYNGLSAGEWTPYNLVRLKADYTVDQSFIGRISDDGGGFNDGWVIDVQLLPDGKMFVGSRGTSFADSNDYYYDLGYLVKLDSYGILDKTFTFIEDDAQVNKVTLLSNKTLLVGGWFEYPTDLLLNLYVGDDTKLKKFDTCDGKLSNIYLSSDFEIPSINYKLMEFSESYPVDDDYLVCGLPLGFSINFLGTTYTSVNVSSNSYITFGDPNLNGGADSCCFDIPNQISGDGPGQPGVYISTACSSGSLGDGLDNQAFFVYSGLSSDEKKLIIKYQGGYHCDYTYPTPIDLEYYFVFYQGVSNYFDMYIAKNTIFYDDNPTGGTSDGSDDPFIGTFDSSSEKSYRIFSDGSVDIISSPLKPNPIKANINTSDIVCGSIGDVITTPRPSLNGGGSMYFVESQLPIINVSNSGGQFGFGGGWDFTIEWYQYFEGGTNSRPFSIGVYSDPNEMIGMSFEGTVYLWVDNNSNNAGFTNDDVLNGWHHIAITRQDISGDKVWKVFLDGIQKTSFTNNVDTSNTYTLTIGNQSNNDGIFNGYITNFRVTTLEALYTSDFIPSTTPLQVLENTILLMLATDESNLATDASDNQSPTANRVTWSPNTPLGYPEYYTATNETSYNDCDSCTVTNIYNVILFVRDTLTNYVARYTMSPEDLTTVINNGGVFVIYHAGELRAENYELLNYYM